MPENVILDKAQLLAVLRKNRANHRAKFLKAQEGYRERAINELSRSLSDARKGNNIQLIFSLPMPEDHTENYDREIRMLEMSQEDKITLTSGEFDMFVMDRWRWTHSFTTSNAAYGVH